MRGTVWAGMGAYLSTAAPGIPTILHGLMLCGPYTIDNVKEDVYGLYTNTTPVEAYRGAGRPEATYLLERLIDRYAHAIGKDPAEVRRINLIPKFDNGHNVATGLTYDSGNYHGALDKLTAHVNYDQLRKEQAEARAKGRYIGIGICTYVEVCGLGPSQVAGAIGFQGGLWESAIVRFHPSGKVNVFIGTKPHGQGEETTFAQIVSSELGVDVNDVKVMHGDTDKTPMGWGTYGSRTTAVGGAALAVALRKIKDKALALSAHLLEASVEDMDYADGKFFVKGAPARAKTIQDVALMANVAWNMPAGMEAGLEASSFYDPPNFVFPFGAHCAVVEVDPDTGAIDLKRYACVDDCGPQINPMIVEGQVHGGVVQGLGQALWEEAVYADNGQLLTGSLMDYAIPARRRPARHRGAVHRHAVAASPARREGHRRGRHHRLDLHDVQRRGRRVTAARRARPADADDPRTRLAGRADGEEGSLTCTHRPSPITEPRHWPTPRSCSPPIPGRRSWPAGTACCR